MMDRWSRRKAAVEAEAKAEEQAVQEAEQAAIDAKQADKTDEELLVEFDLPEPESLGEGADFKAFLADTVPARLKTRALRQLWKVNPVLANLDGLVDYGEDFTDAALSVENLQTAYQVGKGMLAHVQELARQAEEATLDAEPVDDVDPAEVDTDPVLSAPAQTTQDTLPPQQSAPPSAAQVEAPVADAPPQDLPAALTGRRMNFTFEDTRSAG